MKPLNQEQIEFAKELLESAEEFLRVAEKLPRPDQELATRFPRLQYWIAFINKAKRLGRAVRFGGIGVVQISHARQFPEAFPNRFSHNPPSITDIELGASLNWLANTFIDFMASFGLILNRNVESGKVFLGDVEFEGPRRARPAGFQSFFPPLDCTIDHIWIDDLTASTAAIKADFERLTECNRATVGTPEDGHPDSPVTISDSLENRASPLVGETQEKPAQVLFGWNEILDALELKMDKQSYVSQLSKKNNGPIFSSQGATPWAEKAKLIEWWNKMFLKYEEKRNQSDGARLEAEPQHNYGKTGSVSEVGPVKKRRSDRKTSG